MKKHNVVRYLQGKIYGCLLICVMFALGACPTWAAPKDSPWGGDYFPNIELTDQDGKKHKFYDGLIKDKVVAINFIYTHCGDSCPVETANLKRVYALLEDRMGKDIFFYSISIDPKHDTPRVLKEYSERFKVGHGWTFLTGKKADTILLRKKLGLYNSEGEKKLSDHNTNFIIGNDNSGRWVKKTPYDEPMTLAWALGYSLSKNKIMPGGKHAKYTDAKPLPNINKAEEMFRYRCSSCHSLGRGSGLGPGLYGVTLQRDRTWLKRWIKEPDKMLAEKDPIAIDLYNRYNKVLMPNLRLNDSDVEALIDYLDSTANPNRHAH
ncbi:SCO1/SenC/PrrC protein [Methyloglobulus morosus KoM1]|uniref:SCO1/SenC/PrrC protein n=1 Tax=Methyloglobulus morosus KoM1 TaxID=1116472 RepID=V5C1A9_9GAMM|nr:SCO family protein [Methyloglobulus morosus]ESS73884.1 SCO1/SenC/PrrC protein [Methyloglobulus morosus KoM1]